MMLVTSLVVSGNNGIILKIEPNYNYYFETVSPKTCAAYLNVMHEYEFSLT